jgi:hypothetical protein
MIVRYAVRRGSAHAACQALDDHVLEGAALDTALVAFG